MNELSLFTGSGGGILGSKLLGWHTIGYVEYEKYCQEIIKQRIADGILDAAPIFGDIRRFIGEGYTESYRGLVDIVTGGFPCQPFSVAGKGLGENDPRNMWPATIQCIRIIRPQLVFLENVPGILTFGYMGRIFGDLAESGYSFRWTCLGADDVGANHRRKRLWILAHAKGSKRKQPSNSRFRRDGLTDSSQSVSDTKGKQAGRVFEQSISSNLSPSSNGREKTSWWSAEPAVGRVAHGVARRVDRLKAIGNGQVPFTMARAFQILSEGII